MTHYFIEDTFLQDNIQQFSYECRGQHFLFQSNSGIFSPDHVDYATNILLQNIPELSGSILDMGCGYGVIGIVLGKLFHLDVTMADINSRALKQATINCEKNVIEATIMESDGFKSIEGDYQSIVTNPPIHAGKELIFRMYQEAEQHLVKEGCLYCILQKKHGAESSIKELIRLYGNCEVIYKKKGFYILCSTRK